MASKRGKARRAAKKAAIKEQTENSAPAVLTSSSATSNAAGGKLIKKVIASMGGLFSAVLWGLSIALSGIFNVFSSNPGVQLLPLAFILCALIFVILHQFVGGFRLNKGKYLCAAGVCGVIMIVTLLVIHNRTTENQRSASDQKQVLKNTTETQSDVADIKKILTSMRGDKNALTNETDEVEFPGIGFHCVLRLNGLIPNRLNYIFDLGESATSNRMSLYLQPDETLCLRIIDQDSREYKATVRPRLDTFSFRSLTYVACDFVNAGNKSCMRIILNGKTVASQEYAELGNFYPTFDKMRKFVIGSDIEHRNGSSMRLLVWFGVKTPFTLKARNRVLQVFDQMLAEMRADEQGDGITFSGNGGLDVETGSPYSKPFGDANPNTLQPKLKY